MKLSVKTFLFAASLICAALYIAFSIPLIRESIAPNPLYGVRLGAEYETEQTWYEVNRYGGWSLLWSGVAIAVLSIILFIFRKKFSNRQYTAIFVLILLACVLVAAFVTISHAQQLV